MVSRGPFKDLALTVVKYVIKASYGGKVVVHGFRGLVHHSRAGAAKLFTAVKGCPKDYSHHEGPRSKTREEKQEPGLGSLQRSTASDLPLLASPYSQKFHSLQKYHYAGIKHSTHEPVGIVETNQNRALDILNVSMSISSVLCATHGYL